MVEERDLYAELGVDASKKSIRKAAKGRVDNDYPGAFVNIVEDPEDSNKVITQHMDGDGSKILQRLLIYKETGDIGVIKGAADDAWEMNYGDIASCGFVYGPAFVTDVLNIRHIEGDVPKDLIVDEILGRYAELRDFYNYHGFQVRFLGGETADLHDQVRNVVGDACINARALKSDVIAGNVQDGDKIYGFASDGQARWEMKYNSGIMSNGQTLARTYLMWRGYTEKYPFLIRDQGEYKGRYRVGDGDLLLSRLSVSDALVSPTRHWALFIRIMLDKLKERNILHMLHGISMNTGGGATKIGHVGQGIVYKKEMPMPPGIFELIQRESGSSWEKMFRDFNCGVGIDVVGEDNLQFELALREVSVATKVAIFDLGHCEENRGSDNKVELETPFGFFDNY